MRSALTTSLILLVALASAQWNVSFDDSSSLNYIEIDSIINPNNIWHVAVPQKVIFDSAYTLPNVLLTDSVTTYPANDTSVFYLWHTVHQLQSWWPTLSFHFQMDADSMNDFGKLEVSADQGQNWMDVIRDTTTGQWSWSINETGQYSGTVWDTIPFTGKTNGWHLFSLIMFDFDSYVGYTDSILFRFTFISDSIETNQEGWAIDNIWMGEIIMSIDDPSRNTEITIYPNPTMGVVMLDGLENMGKLQVLDMFGRVVPYSIVPSTSSLDLGHLPNGIYFLRIGESIKKVILSH